MTKLRKEQLEISQSDGAIKIPVTTQDKDFEVTVNDGGTTRTAIQVHREEGTVSFPRQSCVYANCTNNQALATGSQTTIIFNNEITDTLGEYNSTNGIFTAKIAGVYSVSTTIGIKDVNSGAGYGIYVRTDSSSVASTYEVAPASTSHYSKSINSNIYLSAGQTIKIIVYHSAGHTEYINATTGSYLNVLTITKVS
jgi:hypothetical protein